MIADADQFASIRPPNELFRRATQALWGTTYNVDIGLFAEFLLPRLGPPPVNAVVLADGRRLASTLARIPAERAGSLTTVNRRWLLRGVQVGLGVFHPKTYVSVAPSKATLLVGSGNLSPDGLDEGRETFVVFRSGTDAGDAALAVWVAWMQELVERMGDPVVAERFADLRQRLPELPASDGAQAPVIHNLQRTILEQYVTRVEGPVDELLLAAPFYDQDAKAVETLLVALEPKAVSIYTATSTQVNGRRLGAILDATGADIRVLAYEPDRFTHAKLVGALSGDRGWLLSGSANLSRAALTRTPGSGNVEMAVCTPLAAEQLRLRFVPPGTSVHQREISALDELDFEVDPEPPGMPVTLQHAVRMQNNTVEVVCRSDVAADWMLDDLTVTYELRSDDERIFTQTPVVGRLVQLVDATGVPLSNRVIIDEPADLAEALNDSAASISDRPREFHAGDVHSSLGRALIWLHRNLVLDVTEQTGSGVARAATSEEADSGDDQLWERLEREQLGRDPRAATYRRLWSGRAGDLDGDEPVLELLEAMRDRLPAEKRALGPAAAVLSLLPDLDDHEGETEAGEEGDDKPKRRWKASTRVRVRARNVLRRWAAAQTDPRLMWIDPLAPAGNFAMVTSTLARIWLEAILQPERIELTFDDLSEVWLAWLRGFAGTGQGDGWLEQLDPDSAQLALEQIPAWTSQTVPLLCWLALRPQVGLREVKITWQPVLSAALDHGLLEPSDTTAAVLTKATGTDVAREAIDMRLVECIEYVDDELWCQQIAQELDLKTARLQKPPGAVDVRVDVAGIADPLTDPRVPQLLVAARHYRRCDGAVVFSSDHGWRVSASDGVPVSFRDPDKRMAESARLVDSGTLETLAATGRVLGELFDSDAAA